MTRHITKLQRFSTEICRCTLLNMPAFVLLRNFLPTHYFRLYRHIMDLQVKKSVCRAYFGLGQNVESKTRPCSWSDLTFIFYCFRGWKNVFPFRLHSSSGNINITPQFRFGQRQRKSTPPYNKRRQPVEGTSSTAVWVFGLTVSWKSYYKNAHMITFVSLFTPL